MRIAKSHYCSAIACSNNRGANKDLSFFRFPKNEDRCKRWVSNLRRQDLKNTCLKKLNAHYYLCAEHFEDSQFMNEKKNKLVWNAEPTLFKIPNPPKPINANSALSQRLKRRTILTSQEIPNKRRKASLEHTTSVNAVVSNTIDKIVIPELSNMTEDTVEDEILLTPASPDGCSICKSKDQLIAELQTKLKKANRKLITIKQKEKRMQKKQDQTKTENLPSQVFCDLVTYSEKLLDYDKPTGSP